MDDIFRKNMKIVILLSSIVIVSAGSINPSPRSVNVALETSFLFEPKDINDNISFIKNIKVFLDKLYKILAPQTRPVHIRSFRAEPRKKKKLTFIDFMKNMGKSIKNFSENKIKEFKKTIDKEFLDIAGKGKSKIKDLIPNKRLRTYVKHSVKRMGKTDVPTLQDQLKKLMDEENPILISFAKNVNEYYDEAEVKKMQKLYRKLDRYLENRMDPSKIVKEFLKVVIFDKFKSLNETTRSYLLKEMDGLSEYLTVNKKFKLKVQGHKKATNVQRKEPPVIELVIGDKPKAKETSESKAADEAFNDLKETIGKHLETTTIKANEANDERKMKAVATNEIVVDNVELIVQTVKKP